MRLSIVLAHVALISVSSATGTQALEQPTVTTTLKIDRERGAACTDINAGAPGAPPTLVMTDVCHDWATVSCFDKLLVRGDGVVADRAQVLFTEENRAVDLVPSWIGLSGPDGPVTSISICVSVPRPATATAWCCPSRART